MKKNYKIIFSTITLLILSSMLIACTRNKITQENANKIKIGMTYDEVVEILGEEDVNIPVADKKMLYWFDKANSLSDANTKIAQGKKIYCIMVILDSNNKVMKQITDNSAAQFREWK